MIISQTFQVRAPIDRVWRFLVDPRQVVTCLPGAELIEVQDERTFVGRVKVKVGPIGASFKGRAQLVDVNESEHRVRLAAEGQEAAGGGSAKMTMTSTMTASPDGATEVTVEASVDIVGKLMQFGRGMIEDVSKQLFRQFASCVRSTLESPAGVGERDNARGATVASASGSGSRGVGASSASSAGAPHAEATTSTRDVPAAGTPPPQARPISVLPLFFRAGWHAITRLFGRAT